jgi:hypothetical protein
VWNLAAQAQQAVTASGSVRECAGRDYHITTRSPADCLLLEQTVQCGSPMALRLASRGTTGTRVRVL